MEESHRDPQKGAVMTMAAVDAARQQGGELYREFLRIPSMSAGLYVLAAATADPQTPHTEDELYYVLEGAGMIHIAGTDFPVGPGALIFVPAYALHHFHSIAADLRVLVFFAPAEGTRVP